MSKSSHTIRNDRPRDGKRDPRNVSRDRDRREARRAKYAAQGRTR